MDKATFHARLKEIPIKDHPDYRPFLCHGHPLDADVFVIGRNPANPGLPNWWDYWKAEAGFNFDQFQIANRKYRRKKSDTRDSNKALFKGLGSLKWVETNVYAIASAGKRALKKANRQSHLCLLDTTSLDLLLEACRPKAIFVHSEESCNHLGNMAGRNDLRDIEFMNWIELTLNGYTTLCYPLKYHLSSKESKKEILSAGMLFFGLQIQQQLIGQGDET